MRHQGVLTKNWFCLSDCDDSGNSSNPSSVSFVSFVVQVFAFPITRSPDHPIYICLITLLSSSTCKFGGQSFQLCRQHTIKSHFSGSWR
jgi:hypothetical protein